MDQFSHQKSREFTYDCYPRSCNGSEHTICKYTLFELGPKCDKVQFNYLTTHYQKEIIYIHNVLRALTVISDKESEINSTIRIAQYKWNNELAEVAQRWANQCDPGNDECRDVDNFKVGQKFENIKDKNIKKFEMYDLIKNWFYVDINDYQGDKFYGQAAPMSVNNHTVIWDNVMLIGCGIIKFSDSNDLYNTYLVCNYRPDE
ncbi:venom allergen 5-like [Microplitis mediator]|uniref:venom allergen 5-like n=1 Tax=Microplitis mediator TaxID=375433 RepID=UPI00255440D5|nr:venom allergen 5-like [Microplitis mediator]